MIFICIFQIRKTWKSQDFVKYLQLQNLNTEVTGIWNWHQTLFILAKY